MKTRTAICSLALVISLGTFASTTHAANKPKMAKSAGLLDGRKFQGTVTEVGKTKGDSDVLVFSEGKFVSSACGAYGLASAVYSAEQKKDGAITFNCEV